MKATGQASLIDSHIHVEKFDEGVDIVEEIRLEDERMRYQCGYGAKTISFSLTADQQLRDWILVDHIARLRRAEEHGDFSYPLLPPFGSPGTILGIRVVSV